SASASRAVRSVSAANTVSSRLMSLPGASCATAPTFQALGQLTSPSSGCRWPRMTLKKVVLPAPLRPTRPMRRPAGRLAVAPDRISRPAIRTTILSIASMGGRIACAGPGGSVIFASHEQADLLGPGGGVNADADGYGAGG